MGLTRVAVLLCLISGNTGVQSVSDGSVCKRDYEDKKSVWRALSGATVVYTPMGHQPKWYWEEVMRRRGMEISEMPSGYEDIWLDQLQGSAQSQVLGCEVHGGRYWELNIDLPKLYKAMAKGHRNAFLRRLSIGSGQTETFIQMPENLPVNWRDTACFPFSCSEQVLVDEIFEERFARDLMGPNAARKLGNATFQDVVQIQELADWSSIKIDFAIGGVDSCGTTSLHRNLNQHPEIVFSTLSEDFFFTGDIVHRLLPLRSQVQSYNAQLERAKDEKERSQGFRPRLVGTCNPVLFAHGLARLKLAAIPQLKMIMIFCDPVGRMEKHFMEYHYCFDDLDLDEAKRRGLVRDRHPNQTCFESATSILSEREGELSKFWLERSVADHMPTMTTYFSGRIAFAHQEQLRENSEQVFTSLAQFLGVEEFQTGRFPRYNSVGGNRTDLCHNQSLVRELQRHLEPEYLMQEEILKQTGQSIPEGLRKRITRCDRSEAARACPHQTVCTDDVATDGPHNW